MSKNSTKKLFCYANIIVMIIFVFLSGRTASAGEATISWTPNTEPDLGGYYIYYGTSTRSADCPPGGYPNKIDVGQIASSATPAYKLENLAGGQTWYFSVTSYDTEKNESCFSVEMSKAMPVEKLTITGKIKQFFSSIINFFKNLF